MHLWLDDVGRVWRSACTARESVDAEHDDMRGTDELGPLAGYENVARAQVLEYPASPGICPFDSATWPMY